MVLGFKAPTSGPLNYGGVVLVMVTRGRFERPSSGSRPGELPGYSTGPSFLGSSQRDLNPRTRIEGPGSLAARAWERVIECNTLPGFEPGRPAREAGLLAG
jgi:hypothetical protein